MTRTRIILVAILGVTAIGLWNAGRWMKPIESIPVHPESPPPGWEGFSGSLEIHGNTFFLNRDDPVITSVMIKTGEWEPVETKVFLDHVKEGDTVLDSCAAASH